MKLKVNGETKTLLLEKKQNKLDLIIKELGYNPQLIVAELNGNIVELKKMPDQKVSEGDNLEIVTIVGGGGF
tara:strand:- start:22 stop:237 length:216 start_codon:yes stop_codon:yes gene_type:complete